MVPLASSPLPHPPCTCVTVLTPCLPEERDGDIDAPVRVPRTCRSDARWRSPKSARRQRPALGPPARSRHGTEPETEGSRTRVLRGRTARLLVCWIRTAAPRRTTEALVAASGAKGYRPARETPLDTGLSSWTGGAVSRRGPTKPAAPATARRGARGTCGSRLVEAASQGTETRTFCHRRRCRSAACP